MKNNVIKKEFKKFLIKELIISLIIPIIFILINFFTKRYDYQWLYDTFPKFYDFWNKIFSESAKILIVSFFIWFILNVIFIIQLYRNINHNFNLIIKSTDKLLENNDEYITMNEELNDIEKKFNQIKQDNIKNIRLAKENEQKKDDLIVYLAHDIKTPLTSILGYMSLLDEIDDMPKEKEKKYIKTVLNKSYRLEELVNELFDTARYNSEKIILEKEEINLNLMLEQIIDDFYPMLYEMNKEIKLNFQKEYKIIADSDKLSRVFTNLIKNAINYSKDNSIIEININKEKETILIDIINEGKEIPKEKIDKIFDKFYRLDSSRGTKTGGSGLGLSIAKDIINLHNGNISVESNPKKTTFHITLPLN